MRKRGNHACFIGCLIVNVEQAQMQLKQENSKP